MVASALRTLNLGVAGTSYGVAATRTTKLAGLTDAEFWRLTPAQLVALQRAERPRRAPADEGTVGDLLMFANTKLG